MLWPCTALGVLVGAGVASVPGALLGGLLGQVVDRRLNLQGWLDVWQRLRGRPPLSQETLLFMLLGRLAKANGRVLPVHIQQARAEMQRLALDGPGQQAAIEAFARGKTGRDNLRLLLHVQRGQADALLRACWRMAWVDARVPAPERELLLLWGKWLGLDSASVDALGREYAPRAAQQPASTADRYQEALRVLGVSAGTDAEQVKRAYRRLLSQHHPDKLIGSGASAERLREATEVTRQLHQAYVLVRKRRGW